jgi:hypothetical protein
MKALCTIVFAGSAAAMAGCSTVPTHVALPLADAPANPLVPRNQAPSHSWMLPDAKSTDLLYVSDNVGASKLLVFSYPEGELEGEVSVPSEYPVGLCSDRAGNVFVTTTGSVSRSYVYEYAHAGTQPIATLTDPGEANGCAVDPVTGNLAVTNASSVGGSMGYYGDVAIFPHAEGTPSTYYDVGIITYDYCAYDDSGNLYVDGNGAYTSRGMIGELPSGAGSFSNITLTEDIEPLSMQWTGSSLLVSSLTHVESKHGPQPIYEIRVSGSSGVVSGPLLLHSPHDMNPYGAVQFWLEGHTLIGPDRNRGGDGLLNFWHYPRGGWPKKIIHRPGHAFGLYGVTMSKTGRHSTGARYSKERRPPAPSVAS